MSAEEFWKDDPQLFVSYRTSFINKKKREMEELDYKCWLQGLYNYDGSNKLMGSLQKLLINILRSFSKKPMDKTEIGTYPKKPYIELEKEKREKKNKNISYTQYQESIMYQGSLKQIYLKRLEEKSQNRKG